MKLTLLILGFALHSLAWAAAPKPTTRKPSTPAGEFAPATKETDISAPPVEKAKAFTITADEVSEAGFVSVGKDGKRITCKVTKDTAVAQGKAAAKFSDIKAGDVVTGTRRQVTETEYELVKVTKFVG